MKLLSLCRPWYSFAVSIPKDLVILIDKSQSMTKPFGSSNRLKAAIKAATAVINSANPNDHVCLRYCLLDSCCIQESVQN